MNRVIFILKVIMQGTGGVVVTETMESEIEKVGKVESEVDMTKMSQLFSTWSVNDQKQFLRSIQKETKAQRQVRERKQKIWGKDSESITMYLKHTHYPRSSIPYSTNEQFVKIIKFKFTSPDGEDGVEGNKGRVEFVGMMWRPGNSNDKWSQTEQTEMEKQLEERWQTKKLIWDVEKLPTTVGRSDEGIDHAHETKYFVKKSLTQIDKIMTDLQISESNRHKFMRKLNDCAPSSMSSTRSKSKSSTRSKSKSSESDSSRLSGIEMISDRCKYQGMYEGSTQNKTYKKWKRIRQERTSDEAEEKRRERQERRGQEESNEESN